MVQPESYRIFKPLTLVVLLLVTLFVFPVVTDVRVSFVSELLWNNTDLFRSTFFAGVFFSLIISLCSLILAFIVALYLRPVSVLSNSGRWVNLLFVPFFLGNVSVAFIFKMVLFNSNAMQFAFESPIKLFSLLGLMQIWQFSSLFAYLFWLSFQSIKPSVIDYATHTRFSRWEFLRDIVVPHVKSLMILLFLMAFLFNFYEDAKLNLIFKASQGTGSELVSQWLYRNFRSDMLINFDFASSKIFSTSLLVIIPIILLIIVVFAVLSGKTIDSISKSRHNISKQAFNNASKHIPYLLIASIAMVIIVPIAGLYISLGNVLLSKAFISLLQPLLLTTIAALFAGLFAIFFAISARLAWPERMSSFNNFSILFVGILFLLLIVPPITLMISGFFWIRFLDISSMTSTTIFWVLGHCFLSLPILGSFALINHFRVSAKELTFHKVHKARVKDVIKFSFTGRFKIEYILTFIFAFSLIWNEAVLNRVFSDSIPSFVSTIIETFSSRNADYSKGLAFFSISLLLATLCIVLWIMVIDRAKTIILANEKARS